MPYKIGLTGGIGSGKSTVCKAFSELGVPTFSADSISHELSSKNQPAYLKIIETFGSSILKTNGELDRGVLGDIVFNDKVLKTRLENILHPMIRRVLHQRADAAEAPYCVLDIPLLINTAERERVDRVLVVLCDQSRRIARIRKRSSWSEEKIVRVMDNQVSDQALMDAADEVVDNNGDITAIKNQVAGLHEMYLGFARNKGGK
jgi:dephospho-CoA kinase